MCDSCQFHMGGAQPGARFVHTYDASKLWAGGDSCEEVGRTMALAVATGDGKR